MGASWFVPLARLRRRRARVDEVRAIRRGLRAETAFLAGDLLRTGADRPTDPEPSAAVRVAAARVLDLKLALAAATGAVGGCSTCARGKPAERGAYAGGDCCSGRTELVFSADETAALALTGSRARDLVLPPGEQAGCAFRGPVGCSLAVAHRPSICVRYACTTLQRELHALGRLDAVEALAHELGAALAAFTAARATRREDALGAALVQSLTTR